MMKGGKMGNYIIKFSFGKKIKSKQIKYIHKKEGNPIYAGSELMRLYCMLENYKRVNTYFT